jgi:dihydrofolate reductase
MNEIPKVVFSNSLTSAPTGAIATGDLAASVTRLKRERPDGYLLARGGARSARSLVATGLIDEYRLVVHPVVLGAGERIFREPLTVAPTSTAVFSGGAVAHVFAAHRDQDGQGEDRVLSVEAILSVVRAAAGVEVPGTHGRAA